MSMLVRVRAVPASTDIRSFDPDDERLTEDIAEGMVAENNFESSERDDSTTLDPSVDISSAISKVSILPLTVLVLE